MPSVAALVSGCGRAQEGPFAISAALSVAPLWQRRGGAGSLPHAWRISPEVLDLPKLALRLPEVFERVTKRHVRKFLRFSAMRSYVSSGIVDLSVTEFLRD